MAPHQALEYPWMTRVSVDGLAGEVGFELVPSPPFVLEMTSLCNHALPSQNMAVWTTVFTCFLSFIIIVESVQRMVLHKYRCQCSVTRYDDISYCVEYVFAFSRQLGRHRFVGSVSVSRYRSFNFWHDFGRGWWTSWRRRIWIVSLYLLASILVNLRTIISADDHISNPSVNPV